MNLLSKIFPILTFLLLFGNATNAQDQDYIDKHMPQAKELSIEYGIPCSIILAVAIVESGSGTGWATKHMHNHFGIVGKNRQKKRNTRYKEYNTGVASFRHFCEVIASKDFYQELKYNYDAELWADAISKCGYSEKPKIWKKRVLNIISSNQFEY